MDEELERVIEARDLKALRGCQAKFLELSKLLDPLHASKGLDFYELEAARARWGVNSLPKPQSRSLFQLVWSAAQDRVLILLEVAAVASVIVHWNVPGGWIEGAAIFVAVLVVVAVNAGSDWHKERLFARLNARNQAGLKVKVRRSGIDECVLVEALTVGDVLLLEPGMIVPADALLVARHSSHLALDESATSGESKQLAKTTELDPFLVSGTKVMDGAGLAVIVAVGEKSFHGRMMMAMRGNIEQTPLQVQLQVLANRIARFGLFFALGLLVCLVVKDLIVNDGSVSLLLKALPDYLIEAITVVVVAVPEGLPMAVTLALAFATNRMLQDGNLVRVLASCETMGRVTTICSDKTGTLTENQMTVTATEICAEDLFMEGVAVNTTAFESPNERTGVTEFIGSATEIALIRHVSVAFGVSYKDLRAKAEIVSVLPFSSTRKLMATSIRLASGALRVHVKGASEVILEKCNLDEERTREIRRSLQSMSRDALRTIALAHVDFEEGVQPEDADLEQILRAEGALKWIGLVGIEDPIREGVPEAVRQCQNAGIFVRMVTGDCRETAESIARRCGILMTGGLVLEGPEFRVRSDESISEMLPRLQVLARSSPLDKQRLVRLLMHRNGEIVAVTGDGSNDGPALRAAHVGFAMGRTGTQLAKEAASIVLLDDDFKSIVKAAAWGRAISRSLRRFLLFQLTVNVGAVLTSALTALTTQQSVLTAVQMLWVNLLMDSLGALALATDPPADDLLQRPPEPPGAPLITRQMLWHSGTQALLQLCICLGIFYSGINVGSDAVLRTAVFNVFVLMQLANELNCRGFRESRGDHECSLGRVISAYWKNGRNNVFVCIWLGSLLGQAAIVQFGGAVFATVPLTIQVWLLSAVVAFGSSIVLAVLVNLLAPWRVGRTKDLVRSPNLHATRETLAWVQAVRGIRARTRFYSALRRRLRESEPVDTLREQMSVPGSPRSVDELII